MIVVWKMVIITGCAPGRGLLDPIPEGFPEREIKQAAPWIGNA
jgi:hypothetical protein